jgi:hypothetical protein
MRRFVLAVATASLPLTAAVSAEPAKAPVRDASQPVVKDTPVLVASADTINAPLPDNQQPQVPQASDPAKPARHARVSTCRCGDQTPPSN